ncbi:hypothetical protein ACLMJK_002687 [Lecanora helva]
MSGADIVGVLASTAQLATYAINITSAVLDLYRRIQNAPKQLQQKVSEINSLIDITKLIKYHELLQTDIIKHHVLCTLEKAQRLLEALEKLKKRVSQGFLRRFWIIVIKNTDKEVIECFERLDCEKIALLMCVQVAQTSILGNIQYNFDQVLGEEPMSASKRPAASRSSSRITKNRSFPAEVVDEMNNSAQLAECAVSRQGETSVIPTMDVNVEIPHSDTPNTTDHGRGLIYTQQPSPPESEEVNPEPNVTDSGYFKDAYEQQSKAQYYNVTCQDSLTQQFNADILPQPDVRYREISYNNVHVKLGGQQFNGHIGTLAALEVILPAGNKRPNESDLAIRTGASTWNQGTANLDS